jgi:hypothetical protein
VRVVVLAVVVAVCGCTAVDRVGESPPRAGSAGVTVELPTGWHSTEGRDGNVIDPLARLAVASSPIRPAASACQTSAYAFADDAIALVLVEWQAPDVAGAKHPPRPARFTPAGLEIARGTHECYRGRFGSAFFEDRGRVFGAYVFVGDRAPESLVEEVCAVLDSIEVRRARART